MQQLMLQYQMQSQYSQATWYFPPATTDWSAGAMPMGPPMWQGQTVPVPPPAQTQGSETQAGSEAGSTVSEEHGSNGGGSTAFHGAGSVLADHAGSVVPSQDGKGAKLQSIGKSLCKSAGKGLKRFREHSVQAPAYEGIHKLIGMANVHLSTTVVAVVLLPETHELLVIFGTADTGFQTVMLVNLQDGSAVSMQINLSLAALLDKVLTKYRFRLFIYSRKKLPRPEKKEP
ncbi:MAG: hypothetical protein ACR2PT_03385 [Endozoicomonas sp.]